MAISRTLVMISLIALPCLAQEKSGSQLGPEDRELIDSVLESATTCGKFETYYAESVWQMESDSELSFVHTVVSRTGDGRARARIEKGAGEWSPEAEVESWEEYIANGKVNARIVEMRLSKEALEVVPNPPQTVHIYDIAEEFSVLEPLELTGFDRGLKKAIDEGALITVDRKTGKSGVVRIDWTNGNVAQNAKFHITYAATLDLSRGCPAMIAFDIRNGEGKVIHEESTEYRDDASGLMIPTTSVMVRTIPPLKRTYRLIEARINAPEDFPADIFTLSFPSGTLVRDKRFGVEYRLSTDEPIDDKLTELATKAKKNQQGGATLRPSALFFQDVQKAIQDQKVKASLARTDADSGTSALLYINLVVVFVLLSAFIAYQTYKHKSQT